MYEVAITNKINGVRLEEEGSRIYLIGNTFSIKEDIKSVGGHWDAGRKVWWIGKVKRDVIVEALNRSQPTSQQSRDEAQGDNTSIIGSAEYKGRTYYVIWQGETKRGLAMKLCFRDGSKVFWASYGNGPEEARWKKRYQEKSTIGKINSYIAKMKTSEGQEEAQDRAAHPGDRRAPGGRTCGMCGSAYCEGAWGGLCAED